MAAFLSLNNEPKSLFPRQNFSFDALSSSQEDVCMTSLFLDSDLSFSILFPVGPWCAISNLHLS